MHWKSMIHQKVVIRDFLKLTTQLPLNFSGTEKLRKRPDAKLVKVNAYFRDHAKVWAKKNRKDKNINYFSLEREGLTNS